MADVNSDDATGGGRLAPLRGRDRGQLFIVGALALSVILVALAVLLNTAIYTGNVATRDTGVETATVVEYESEATSVATRTLHHANYHNNSSYEALHDRFTTGVARWDRTAGQHVAIGGGDGYLNVSTTNGTRIVQDSQRTFTNAGGSDDWELGDDVHVRNFTVAVDESTLPTRADADDVDEVDDFTGSGDFYVEIHDVDEENWQVYVYYYSAVDEVRVTVIDSGSSLEGTCSTSTTDPTVDLTNASLDGSRCDALTFWSAADESYEIDYENAGTVEGTYSLVVDKDISALDTGDYNDAGSGTSPYVTPAIYSADLTVTYRSPAVYYRTTHRLAPGEPDA